MDTLHIILRLKEIAATGNLGHQKTRLVNGVFLVPQSEFHMMLRVQRENRIYTSLPVLKYHNGWYLADNLIYLVCSFVKWVNYQEEKHDIHNGVLGERPRPDQTDCGEVGRDRIRHTVLARIPEPAV